MAIFFSTTRHKYKDFSSNRAGVLNRESGAGLRDVHLFSPGWQFLYTQQHKSQFSQMLSRVKIQMYHRAFHIYFSANMRENIQHPQKQKLFSWRGELEWEKWQKSQRMINHECKLSFFSLFDCKTSLQYWEDWVDGVSRDRVVDSNFSQFTFIHFHFMS